MFKRIVAIILAGSVLLIYGVQPAFAKSKEEKQAQLTERVKSGISKLGVGQDARVEVKLHDRTKLIGYISEVKNESFTITDPKTSAATTVSYDDVTQVKGHSLSTGAKIGIGIGIGIAVAAITMLIVWSVNGWNQ